MKAQRRFMIRFVVYALAFLAISACKSKIGTVDGSLDDRLTAKTIIKNHYKNQLNFNTFSGRMKVAYFDGVSSQSIGLNLRMEKDRAIWLSAPLGIAKAFITPDRVLYYNKLENQYFDGDFRYISQFLGTELNFDQLQNILLGQALMDLRSDDYDAQVNGEHYVLKPQVTPDIFKTLFQIEPRHFKIAAQQLSQPWKKRLLEIRYTKYQEKDKHIVPEEIDIVAINTDDRTHIDIVYRNVEFDRKLNFPFRIPEGYQEIVLD